LGVVVASRRFSVTYDPFGYRPSVPGVPLLGFNGQRAEEGIEGYLLGHGHRMYSPVTMRFHRPDQLSPFGKGGLNAYAYCRGDPINRQDPEGRFVVEILQALKQVSSAIGHVKRVHAAVFLPRPLGLLGLARGLTDVGYVGMVVGVVMRAAGHAAGDAVLGSGVMLVTTGKQLKKVDKAIKAITATSLQLARSLDSAFGPIRGHPP
jgi:RHS repeat-associated protein